MTTITLPAEIERPLAEEARRRGTTPEVLAIDTLRQHFQSPVIMPSEQLSGSSLADFLVDHVGLVHGTTEPLSERFAEGVADS
jgi:hypothetical protein